MEHSALLCILFNVLFLSLHVLVQGQGSSQSENYKITTIPEPPFVIYDGSKSGNEAFTGFIPDILTDIAKLQGFSYSLQKVGDGKYGRLEGGSWNGMIGELHRGVVHMAAAPMTVSQERKGVVDFSDPFASTTITILYTKPSKGEKAKFKSVTELAGQSEIKYGLVKDGVTMNFFKNSSNEIYKKMWNEMSKDPSLLVSAVSDGIVKVRQSKGKYAFIMEDNMAEYYINQPPCDLVKISEVANEQQYAFAFKKGSRLKSKVNSGLRELRAKGRLRAMHRNWWGEECTNTVAEDNAKTNGSPSAVTAMSTTTIVLAIFVGLIL